MLNELPKINYKNKTYYVDIRLQEFRRIKANNGMYLMVEFIPFKSELGKTILNGDFLYETEI